MLWTGLSPSVCWLASSLSAFTVPHALKKPLPDWHWHPFAPPAACWALSNHTLLMTNSQALALVSWQLVCRVRLFSFAICSTDQTARSCVVGQHLMFIAMTPVTSIPHHERSVFCTFGLRHLDLFRIGQGLWFAFHGPHNSELVRCTLTDGGTATRARFCVLCLRRYPIIVQECVKALQLCV